jgi:hypothetical protein
MVLIAKADPPYRGGTLSSHEAVLKQHLVATRAILSGVWLAADVPKVREEAIETLLDAMREINVLAKTTPPDDKRPTFKQLIMRNHTPLKMPHHVATAAKPTPLDLFGLQSSTSA